ncbi:hypothetical protein [Aurantiacibacter suaedae]|uniref:hypothetical protein n=1 Tax=Aurantiacibacter suaedae TaxID=2545755 RepID=UPI0010F56BDA|nr:hypothetical protein [Aurantiacibacter suaedae]
MRQPIFNAALLVAACGLLTACDLFSDEPDESAIDESNVSGEVLEGTISDDMLPLDELHSAPPPVDAAPSGTANAAPGADAASDEAATEQPEESAPEAPAEVPAPAEADEAAN